MIIDAELKLPEARQCVAQLVKIGHSVHRWLLQNKGFDDVMADLRALNPLFMVFAPKIQAGFTTRLKSEQATMRRLVIRMDTMRRTSYVSAGYLIAEITALVILVLLLITDIGELTPTVLVVGVISYLLFYVLALIRDLDNPFEYYGDKPGAADVNLEVLEHSEDRLRGLLTTMGASALRSDRTPFGPCRPWRGGAGKYWLGRGPNSTVTAVPSWRALNHSVTAAQFARERRTQLERNAPTRPGPTR